jgi:hypothetical protein
MTMVDESETVLVNERKRAVWRRHFGPMDRIGVNIGAPDGAYYRCIASDDRGQVFESVDQPRSFKAFTHAEITKIENSGGYTYDRNWFATQRPPCDPTKLRHSTLDDLWRPAVSRGRDQHAGSAL